MSEFFGFEVKESVELGRYLIAKRDYSISDLILDEEPLLIAPFGKQDISSCASKSAWECLGCFKILFPEELKFCPKCQWPVCCTACAEESLHAKYECPIFEEKKTGVSAEVYSNIYLLRAILMYKDQENPTPWGKFSSLSASSNPSQEGCLPKSTEEIEELTQFLKQRFQINVDPKIVAQITGVWKVNAFGSLEEIETDCFYRVEALFSVASMFAHSCAPNAEFILLPKDCNGIKKWNLRAYTRRNIRCGEAINISYFPDCFNLDTAARSWSLWKHFGFECKCNRCCDATDLFLYTEAVKCPCGDETLIADVPNDEYSSWTCNHCGVSKPFIFAKTCVENFRALIQKPYSKTSPEILISMAVKCGLGPNHREIILNMFYWIQAHGREEIEKLLQHSTKSDEIFMKFLKSATKCLKTLRMFGVISDIVELESCFAKAIATYYFKTTDFRSIQYNSYLPEEKKKIITAICAHLKIAVDIVELCPYNILYLFFRQDLIDGYKFWKDELHALKDVCSVGTSHYLDEMSGSGVQVIGKVSEPELKTSSNELSNSINKDFDEDPSSEALKKAVEMEHVAVRQSSGLSPHDVISSSWDSNVTFMKPSLSILTEFDF